MNGIQRYTINLIENEIDQSCPYIEKYKMPDGKWCKYSDVEAALSASPWIPVSERLPELNQCVVFAFEDYNFPLGNSRRWVFDAERYEGREVYPSNAHWQPIAEIPA